MPYCSDFQLKYSANKDASMLSASALDRSVITGWNSYIFLPIQVFQNPSLDHLPIWDQDCLKTHRGEGKWFKVVDGWKWINPGFQIMVGLINFCNRRS